VELRAGRRIRDVDLAAPGPTRMRGRDRRYVALIIDDLKLKIVILEQLDIGNRVG